MEDNGGKRPHDPSLRELTSELDGLRDLMSEKIGSLRDVLNERDKLYTQRDGASRTAVDAALAAVKEQTKASFEASEKAIVKAEEAQKAYNTAHNDLARKMDDQSKMTMPRSETEARFNGIEEKIASVKDSVTSHLSAAVGGEKVKDESRANLSILISVIVLIVAVVFHFIGK